jgi:hypothetical protein
LIKSSTIEEEICIVSDSKKTSKKKDEKTE